MGYRKYHPLLDHLYNPGDIRGKAFENLQWWLENFHICGMQPRAWCRQIYILAHTNNLVAHVSSVHMIQQYNLHIRYHTYIFLVCRPNILYICRQRWLYHTPGNMIVGIRRYILCHLLKKYSRQLHPLRYSGTLHTHLYRSLNPFYISRTFA